jgi:hypothetical protein
MFARSRAGELHWQFAALLFTTRAVRDSDAANVEET